MNDILGIVNIVVGLVIAVAGLVISLIEFQRYGREKKYEKALKETEKRIIEGVEGQALGDAVKKLKEKIKEVEDNDLDKIQEYDKCAKKVCAQYEEFEKVLTPLYERLLKDESQFAMSYGFGRYIDAFRIFLNRNEDLEKVKKVINEFADLNNKMFGENSVKETRESIFKRVARLAEIWRENPTFNDKECIDYHVAEMQIQYKGYSPDQNIFEQAVYDYFSRYYKCKSAINILINNYFELIPYIEELKIKYR